MNIVAAVIQSRRAAPTVARLMETMGLGRVALEALVARAEAAGQVEYWEAMDAVTLSPLGAERLKVRLAGRRWIRAEDPDPVDRIGKGRVATVSECDLIAVDARNNLDRIVADRSPSAEAMLAEFELREAEVARCVGVGTRRRRLRPLVPRVLVGSDGQWPIRATSRACPYCEGRPLGLVELCLYCARSGVDDRQPADPGRKKRKKKRRPTPVVGPRLVRLAELLAASAGA